MHRSFFYTLVFCLPRCFFSAFVFTQFGRHSNSRRHKSHKQTLRMDFHVLGVNCNGSLLRIFHCTEMSSGEKNHFNNLISSSWQLSPCLFVCSYFLLHLTFSWNFSCHFHRHKTLTPCIYQVFSLRKWKSYVVLSYSQFKCLIYNTGY